MGIFRRCLLIGGVVVLATSVGAGDGKRGLNSYARVLYQAVDGRRGFILQTSVRELRHPKNGVTVVLLSMVHTGTPEYFRAMTRFVSDAQVVLAEGGIKPEKKGISEVATWVERFFKAEAQLLGLKLQRDWEASVKTKQWKVADLSQEELLATTTDAQFPEKFKARVVRWEKALESGSESDLARAKDDAYQRQLSEMRQLAESAREGGAVPDVLSELHKQREKRMWEVIAQHLKSGEHKRVALVFGAWHSYALEPRIVRELGFKHHTTWWQDAVSYLEPE